MHTLASPVEQVLEQVFAALPPKEAMRHLTGAPPIHHSPALTHAHRMADLAAQSPLWLRRLDLQAALWLYVGDFQRAQQTVTQDSSPTGAFWQAILRRRKGDYDNALFWYGKADDHPAMESVNLSGGTAGAGSDVARFDPVDFVARVRRHAKDEHPPADLLALQEREWRALFHWCAER